MARKYELETIPIWDAFDMHTECPLCVLDERAEKRYLDFFLGNSVMIPEMRVEVNRTAFCGNHFYSLFDTAKNRHPLGLITHTHLKDRINSIEAYEKQLLRGPGGNAKQRSRKISRYISHLIDRERTCMICDRMKTTIERYTFTIVYLWRHKEDFAKAFRDSKGFCYYHLVPLMEMATAQLKNQSLARFVEELVRLQQDNVERLEGELLWYTQKFDFQNDDKPWGTSKDALNRALQKITGRIYRDQ